MKNKCPYCNTEHNYISTVDFQEEASSDGDWNICSVCLNVSTWKNGILIKPSTSQLLSMRIEDMQQIMKSQLILKCNIQ